MCLEKMEQVLLEGVARGQEEVLAKEEWVEVGWEERALEPGPVGIVSVPIVEQSFLIRQESLAIV
ncbi:unnamed protein product [marine sediment metagenome]|uniref:Uncharacterized protein n=1 Tax=marine sediment metagenome TaxID=412755 RepID=X1R854_9ZZZZ